ncbi:MAG: beta-lactamase family protein [Spirochaetales bacterium]|jgi:D-alanyl-D-alanine carboxypeptidase|nr:beta-lactamase family protein [Spirochaetales bacterium]
MVSRKLSMRTVLCSKIAALAAAAVFAAVIISSCATYAGGWSSLSEAVAATRSALGTPALSAAVFDSESILEHVTIGTISLASDLQAGSDSRWHIGSCTKAMTAALTGRLVEKGVVQFESTIGEVFSSDTIHLSYNEVPVSDLLRHIGGVTGLIYKSHPAVWQAMWIRADEEQRTVRKDSALAILKDKPSQQPGKFKYSNGGIIIAGTMLEILADESWENLIRDELFDPLSMETAGFGAPGTYDPWPHQWVNGDFVPVDPDLPGSDNPPALGPAGTVHVSIPDWIKFLQIFIGGGPAGFLSADVTQELLREAGQNSAAGWFVVDRKWAGGTALNHEGSNTMNYTIVWLAPEKNRGIVLATNGANPATPMLLNRLAAWMTDTYITPF